MANILRVWLLLLSMLQHAAAAMEATSGAAASTVQPASCNNTCGAVKIPYPFGVGEDCFMKRWDADFSLACNYAFSPPKLFLGNYEVLDISLSDGQLRVKGLVAHECYNVVGGIISERGADLGLQSPLFRFSNSQNKFVVLGCDTYAFINGMDGVEYTGGCMSDCKSFDELRVMGEKCSGVGCCEVAIPKGLRAFNVRLGSFQSHTNCLDFSPCGYAFLVEKDSFSFDAAKFRSSEYRDDEPSIILDWFIWDQTCEEADKNDFGLPSACRSNLSECFNSGSGVGYNCRCKDGYEGNPYVPEGCRDVDECERNTTICPWNGICTNTVGGYNCGCPAGTFARGDPKSDRCESIHTGGGVGFMPLLLTLGLGVGVVVAISFCIFWKFQREKHVGQTRKVNDKEFKEKLFEQNGGLIMRDLLSSSRMAAETFTIFAEEELVMATNDFDESQIAGRGGHGIVYRGRLADGTEVAIRKSRMVDKRQKKEFARDIGILSQINHINVVKLLGCCLEVEIPILVYEYVACGTLYDFIHNARHRADAVSLATRMRIAIEAAEALAYLQSYASCLIHHGDVKSTHILLDEQYRVKVSVFGVSTLAPVDEVQLATLVQGNCGYMDPEYLQTYKLTTKSDVYSFGVVLAELLTGKKPLQLLGPEDERGLAATFVSALKQNKLMQILDAKVVEDGEPETLWEIAQLTSRCLSLKGDDRPAMKEVVTTLHVLAERQLREHPYHWTSDIWHAPEETETESLLGTSHVELSTFE